MDFIRCWAIHYKRNRLCGNKELGGQYNEKSAVTLSDNTKNYEYILPMEYTKIERCQNCYIAYDKQDKCAIYDLNGQKLSDDYDYIGSFFNEQVAEARRDNQYYIINSYGTVLG